MTQENNKKKRETLCKRKCKFLAEELHNWLEKEEHEKDEGYECE